MVGLQNFRVDSFVSGLAIKAPVLVATDAPVTLSAEQTVNSRVLVSGDRVLVKDQADPIENGIYNVETSAWQRTGDMDGERDLVGGTVVPAYRVSDGLFVYWIVGGTGLSLSPGTDALTFTTFFDPSVAGATVPPSTIETSVLIANNAGTWVEESDLLIDSNGNLITTGNIEVSDGVDSVRIDVAGAIATISGQNALTHIVITPNVRFSSKIYQLEDATADADQVGYGQWWVRASDEAPMFTDESGVDHQLNVSPSFAAPLVLLDDEQIEFGTDTDLTIEWTAAGLPSGQEGLHIQLLGAGSFIAFEDAPQLRFYNAVNDAYISLENIGTTTNNEWAWQSSGAGVSIINYEVGGWNWNDNSLIRPVLDDYSIQHASAGSVSNVLVIDFEGGNSRALTMTENITTVTLSNPPASGLLGQVEIEITQDGGSAYTITWPGSVLWPGGTAPVISTLSSVTLVHLRTRDGGTTYLGTFLENFS
jgi:hypothetical protein